MFLLLICSLQHLVVNIVPPHSTVAQNTEHSPDQGEVLRKEAPVDGRLTAAECLTCVGHAEPYRQTNDKLHTSSQAAAFHGSLDGVLAAVPTY